VTSTLNQNKWHSAYYGAKRPPNRENWGQVLLFAGGELAEDQMGRSSIMIPEKQPSFEQNWLVCQLLMC